MFGLPVINTSRHNLLLASFLPSKVSRITVTYVDGPFDARVIFGSGVDDAVRRIVASLPDAVSYRRNKDGNYVDY